MSASTDYYESTGTIRLKIEGQETEFVFFVPDENHCVNHQGEKCAVFLLEGLCKADYSCKPVKGIIVPIKKCLNSVKLKFNIHNPKMNTALPDAAMKQSKVDVKVEYKEGKKLKLIGITVPALSVK